MRTAWMVLTLVVALCSSAFASPPTPTMSVSQAIAFWIDTFVSAGYQNGEPVFRDCYAFMDERVPPRLLPLAKEMEKLGGYLMNESLAQMVGDPEGFVGRMKLKSDWSPAVRAMVRGAIVRAGFVVPDETAGTATPDPNIPTCDTGRCDCQECSPHIKCDCATVTKMDGPTPIECADPKRFNCNLRSWKKPEWPEQVPWMATRPATVGLIRR